MSWNTAPPGNSPHRMVLTILTLAHPGVSLGSNSNAHIINILPLNIIRIILTFLQIFGWKYLKNKMDLLQELSSVWNEFLRKPCPWVDLLSFWHRHPWNPLSLDTLGTFCPLKPLVQYCTVPYCTVLYCTVPYCTTLYCTVLYCTILLLFLMIHTS